MDEVLLAVVILLLILMWRRFVSTANTLATIIEQQKKTQADVAILVAAIRKLQAGATILGPGQVVVNQADLDAVSTAEAAIDTSITAEDAEIDPAPAPVDPGTGDGTTTGTSQTSQASDAVAVDEAKKRFPAG